MIYDSTGMEVFPPTELSGISTSDISATALNDGSVLIAYRDTSNQGKSVVIDPSGTITVESTIFEDSGTNAQISAAALLGGEVIIGYSDLGDRDRGKFVIVK